MSINLEQFHQTFFEESFEGLDSMETGLLNLQAGADKYEYLAGGAFGYLLKYLFIKS